MDSAATTAATATNDYLRGPRPVGVGVDEMFMAQLWDFHHQDALQEALKNRDFSYLSEADINKSLADYEALGKFPANTNWDPAAFAEASTAVDAAAAFGNDDANAVSIGWDEKSHQPDVESHFDLAMEGMGLVQDPHVHGLGNNPAPLSIAAPVPNPLVTTTAPAVTLPPPVVAVTTPPIDTPAALPSVHVIRLQFTFEGRKLKGKKMPKWIAMLTITTVRLAELVESGLFFNYKQYCYDDRFLNEDWNFRLGQDEERREPMYKRLVSFPENLSDDFLTAQVEVIGRTVRGVRAFNLKHLCLNTMVTAEVEKLGNNGLEGGLLYYWDREDGGVNVEMPQKFGGRDNIYGIAQGWWPWPKTRQQAKASSPASSSSSSF